MSNKKPITRALSLVLPSGALGASVLLALSSAQAAASPSAPTDSSAGQASIAARLRAIRAGVAEIATPGAEGSAQISETRGAGLVPTWWGNGGWGRWHGGWGNGGWRFGWHNGGWGNGGWGNGGWGNGGWPNGWHNWGNGWHNFWHNG
ncbi:MAG TPA: GrrA/OscA1 family cyclophane-containing rSAM-modified RiPP [Steroidobacteraceae bacterium]|jgi:rSAM-associated Gly-rich repeat protein|nr:GrrA/OscA1 family cyclophane-containing rSAM-modified RiPP [Steroidobacteraceae bacterium]